MLLSYDVVLCCSLRLSFSDVALYCRRLSSYYDVVLCCSLYLSSSVVRLMMWSYVVVLCCSLML